jgi:hypothetical protein
MPFPTSQDVLSDIEQLPHESQHRRIPEDLHLMVEHWVSLIRLSSILGEILSLLYQQLGKQPTLLQFESLEDELGNFVIPEPSDSHQSPLAMFSYYQLQLHYQ